MMNHYFADTSFILALFNTSDEYHKQAIELKHLTIEPNKIITTEAILLEIGNSLSKLNFRQQCSIFIEGFYKTDNIQVVPITTDLIMEGLELFRSREDKEWGLVDCISFITMKKYNIYKALTTDDHFIQAGFQALLIKHFLIITDFVEKIDIS